MASGPVLVLAVLLGSRLASAQPAPVAGVVGVDFPGESTSSTEPSDLPPRPIRAFGAQGEWVVLSTSSSAGISSETFSASAASFVSANIGVGVDYFVARHFSLGIDAEAGYGDTKGYGATSLVETTSSHFSGGVRFGVDVPLGRLFSWYPRLSLGLQSDRSDTQTVSSAAGVPLAPATSTSTVGPWINVYAPILVHPVPHLFFGIGPRVQHVFGDIKGGPYDGSQSTLVSADTVLGGWWGGSQEPEAAQEERPADHAFGEKGQVVLTGATVASLASYTYSKSNASTLDVNFDPSFDYFVIDRVSLGAEAFIEYSKGTYFDSNGTQSNASTTSIGIAPRVGVDLPIVRGVLSLWPQAEIGFGSVIENDDSALGSNDHKKSRSWIVLSAPLLVHVTTHFFMGAGPYFFHELSDSDQNHYENDATSVSATFLLGGWL